MGIFVSTPTDTTGTENWKWNNYDKSSERLAAIDHLKRYYSVIFTEYRHVGLPKTNVAKSWVDLTYEMLLPPENEMIDAEGNIENVIIENLKARPMVIVGQGGFGKSILTKRLAMMWSQGKLTKYYDLLLCVSGEDIQEVQDVNHATLLGLVLGSIEHSLKKSHYVIEYKHAETTAKWLGEQQGYVCHASQNKTEGKERTLIIIDGWNYFDESSPWHEHLLLALQYPGQLPYDLIVTTQPTASAEPLDITQILINGFADEVQHQEFVGEIAKFLRPANNLDLVQQAFDKNETFPELCQSPKYLSYLCFCVKERKIHPGDDTWRILELLYTEIFKDKRCHLSREYIDGCGKPILASSQILKLGNVAFKCLLQNPEGQGFQADHSIYADDYCIFSEWPQCHITGILHKKFSNGLECWFPSLEAQVFFAKNWLNFAFGGNVDDRLKDISADRSSTIATYRTIFELGAKLSTSQISGITNGNAERLTEPVRGHKAVEILEQKAISHLFKNIDPMELLPHLTPWFIRKEEKSKIISPLKDSGNTKMAASNLLEAIIQQFEEGNNKDKICIQDLIEALEWTRKYPDLIYALENTIEK